MKNIVQTDYCCPICNTQLNRQYGNSVHPNDPDFGVGLTCPQGDPDGKKHPQDVSGHGKTEKEAYSVILAKFATPRNK